MAKITKAEKAARKAERLKLWREMAAILKSGRCPQCQTKLYRNLALPGWYQCGHYGSEGFQKESGPHCTFQFFYDPTPEEAAILAKEQQ